MMGLSGSMLELLKYPTELTTRHQTNRPNGHLFFIVNFFPLYHTQKLLVINVSSQVSYPTAGMANYLVNLTRSSQRVNQ